MQTVAFMLLSVAAVAQNVVSGKVTDSTGMPLTGVTVIETVAVLDVAPLASLIVYVKESFPK